MPRRKKKKKSNLFNVLDELGPPPIDLEPVSPRDAILIAEEQGMIEETPEQTTRECHGKRCYPTHREAARFKKARLKKGASRLRIYHCPDCKNFHLSSSIHRPPQ